MEASSLLAVQQLTWKQRKSKQQEIIKRLQDITQGNPAARCMCCNFIPMIPQEDLQPLIARARTTMLCFWWTGLLNISMPTIVAQNPHKPKPWKLTSWYFHFPPLSSNLLPKKVIESVKNPFGFILRHWLFCYLSPRYLEITTVLFAFFPLRKISAQA